MKPAQAGAGAEATDIEAITVMTAVTTMAVAIITDIRTRATIMVTGTGIWVMIAGRIITETFGAGRTRNLEHGLGRIGNLLTVRCAIWRPD
jgi:hypothetical protein